MDKRELNRERRRQRALERFGRNDPRCVVCGYGDPLALELHHVAGRDFGDELAIVCRNHHRPLSDHQKDHPPSNEAEPNQIERTVHFLEGLADLFELLVNWLRDHATKLLAATQTSHTAKG
jgi:5-methylcytosine-specific restriction endonuclease McrA